MDVTSGPVLTSWEADEPFVMALQDILYPTPRTANMSLLHPKAREQFMMLEYKLASAFKLGNLKTWFRPFETYRHPARQAEAVKIRTSRAGPYESAHQFGLAVDFVAWSNGRWSWDPGLPWLDGGTSRTGGTTS